ncbi:MAG: conserved phage C-terminal domain-containing protein [Clostridiaceae bacterium]
MDQGWIKTYRSIKQHWIWEDKPFRKGQAWLDILLSANHKDIKIYSKGELKDVKAGSFLTSDNILATKWGWTRKSVRKFLTVLEIEKMVTTERTSKGTTLSVVNWEFYQCEGTSEDTRKGTAEGTSRVQAGYTNKNDNNIKNNIYSRVVDYLNQKAGTNFRTTTKKTQSLISARIKDGFTLKEFEKVIDVKVREWKNTEMEKYLRPETLFGTKFEGYLNQKQSVKLTEEYTGGWDGVKQFT